MYFWLLALVLTLIVIAIILRVLVRGGEKSSVLHNTLRISVYKHRINEIDEEVGSGIIDAIQADAAREEAERDLLQEVSTTDDNRDVDRGSGTTGKGMAASLAVFVIGFTLPVYLMLGSPGSGVNGVTQQQQSVESMVATLEQRLEQYPDDINGWSVLVQFYMAQGRYDDAVTAAEKLYGLAGDEPGVLLRYIHTLLIYNDSKFTEKTEALVKKLLTIEPENNAGLWFAGLAAEQRGDNRQAVAYWNRLVPALANEPEAQARVKQLIATSEKKILEEKGTIPAGKAVNLTVSLSPQLLDRVEPDATVFVFARAVDGPPMPLAVVKYRVDQLPLDVVLDDSLAMTPAHKLSDYDRVDVVARISKSGLAGSHSGDLEGSLAAVSTSADAPINIIIDNELE